MSGGLDTDIARHRLCSRLDRAVAALPEQPPTPTVVVDLDAFDANAADLVRRAGGKPVRVASKSLRVPALIGRALAVPGFAGVLSYALREALWLHREGICQDVLMGYPSVDRAALRALVTDPAAAAAVTLMVDDVAQLDLVDALRDQQRVTVRVAVDVDAGLRVGGARVGVMTYEGQVAGVPDDVPRRPARSLAVRGLKAASVHQLTRRRREIAAGIAEVADLALWNAGGSGSIESSAADPVVTEVTAGSGLLAPGLFDDYRSFDPRPAAFFGLRVVRRPARDCVTVAGGGLIASGPTGKDRSPLPWAPPQLRLTTLEGAGEVQTPLVGAGAAALSIGDLVWFRHAKSGELAEHTPTVHLLSDARIADSVPTYRGTGNSW